MYLCGPECCDDGGREVDIGPGYEEIAEGRSDEDGIYQSIHRLCCIELKPHVVRTKMDMPL